MQLCPICGSDRDKDISSAKRVLHAAGVSCVDHNPGGIGILMHDGSRLHLMGECNACDEREILRFVKKVGCRKKLSTGQYWSFCGETDMGQTEPALCVECGGEFRLAES